MGVQQKVMLIFIYTVMVCGTILYVFLFIALWPYRSFVGASLLFVIILVVLVWLRSRITEQNLRRERYHYQDEIPLDETGEPRYWPRNAQPNQHRHPIAASPAPYAASYQQYGQPYEGGYRE